MPEADLVMQGGGVKGIALVGAVEVLEERGYTFHRVAGTSAGAIAASLVAAGIPATRMVEILKTADYRRFQDGSWWDDTLIGKVIDLVTRNGIYHGEYLRRWLGEQLRTYGAYGRTGTFADLAYQDPDPEHHPLPPERRFRLIVATSDISAGRLRYLPWDYRDFGRDPSAESVADAVRTSMSIPFFYRPVRWTTPGGRRTWFVDGGMLSNFPVDVFDAPPGVTPRWPTFGIMLGSRPDATLGVANPVRGTLSFGFALLRTMMGFYDRMHIDEDGTIDRTIFIDTGKIRTTQFDLSDEDRDMLYRNGRTAAEQFLDGTADRPGWDFAAYVAKYRS
ncbi:patatin-like phospholipase family protein [Raineyella sp. W15-4]|uniref:patatin-like phospholipase family protein n=1 Tax=Raineyella sp. W15-4 TaxID=3081651 RepID=UPI0029534BFB|nr:patatin-like phospholipase family protein [Raineyella sp. W15-4]WOQ18054.1 patatin-like phospholipase family protein [Raineyella sp. W15-4]